MASRTDATSLEAACRAGLGEPPPEVSRDVAGARRLLEWLVARIERRRYGVADLHAGYCARTPREVLAQGDVPFTAPCADLSGVAALLLARAGIPATLVLGGIVRPLRPVRFQTGLELDVEGEGGRPETWVAGFAIARSSFYAGRFEPTPRRPYVYRVRPDELTLDRPLLEHFCEGGREGVVRLVPGYDLARDLRDHAWRSGWLSFGLARRRAREAPPATALAQAPRWEGCAA